MGIHALYRPYLPGLGDTACAGAPLSRGLGHVSGSMIDAPAPVPHDGQRPEASRDRRTGFTASEMRVTAMKTAPATIIMAARVIAAGLRVMVNAMSIAPTGTGSIHATRRTLRANAAGVEG